jgi:3-oxoacyl-[acyl-carrier protein] reductase
MSIVDGIGNSMSQTGPFIQVRYSVMVVSLAESKVAWRYTMAGLSNKVALVTGGSRGIGRAIAHRLARDGATVAINYVENSDAANSLIAEIEAIGGNSFAVQARVGSAAETKRLFVQLDNELNRRMGRPRLDILVNNAGIGYFGKLSETAEEDFDRLFTINTKGPFLVTTSALQRMNDGGRVINISSGASRRPSAVFGAYAMSKAAVDAMTLALAAELGPRGITVNTVAPGWTATEANAAVRQDAGTVRNVESQTALGRLGMPDDIARVVAFLASDDAAWVTGQYVEASGGFGSL